MYDQFNAENQKGQHITQLRVDNNTQQFLHHVYTIWPVAVHEKAACIPMASTG